jgi:hypothetical protein
VTMRFRSLRLRAIAANGVYGADVPFNAGLTVLWADNTRGKSTCMQGMLYALGMERMLSPRREIPLPHAMTSYLNTDDNKRVDILESSIALELENSRGQIITVNRAVKASTDTRLVSVDFGPALTDGSTPLPRQNFFVLDAGAAQREDGFHDFLEGFLGWRLPQVRRYDAPETKLYLETVFPLFWVEQKFGWSAIPAAIPTYMRIREVHKRAVEFILDLDVYKLEMQRERLAERIASNAKDWSSIREELERFVLRSGGRTAALSEKPIADPDALARAHIQIADSSEWSALSIMVSRYRALAASLASAAIPDVENQSGEVAEKLQQLGQRVDELNALRINLHHLEQLKMADTRSLQRRIETLEDDLAKNLDVQKLQRYSGIVATLAPDRCPTCEQALSDTLLSQEALSAVNLRNLPNVLAANALRANLAMCSQGVIPANDGFKILDAAEAELLKAEESVEPTMVKPYIIGNDLNDRFVEKWIVDAFDMKETDLLNKRPAIHHYLKKHVYEERMQNPRAAYRTYWWLFAEPRRRLRESFLGLLRFIATPYTAQHRTFQFWPTSSIPDAMVYAFRPTTQLSSEFLALRYI